MSGATFHPVNLHPNDSALSSVDGSYMILSDGGSVDFAARADRTDAEIDRIWTVLTTWTPGVADSGAALKLAAIEERVGPPAVPPDTACDKVKVQ
jgi:hypothetical protein